MILGPDGRPAKIDRKYLTHSFGNYRSSALYGWDLDRIRAARDAHMVGSFGQSEALIASMAKDAAIYAARLNRVAPALGLPRSFSGGASDAARDEASATFLRGPQGISLAMLADAFDVRAMAGFAVLQVLWSARPDGSRLDARLELWPISALVWRDYERKLYAQTTDGLVEVVHGDGKWIVVATRADRPWQWGALVPLALTWGDRSFGIRDRSRNAEAHGEAKPVGFLPEGVDVEGPEGQAMAEALVRLHAARGLMLAPHGSEVKYLESMNQAWQIFREIIGSNNTDIAKILLGQDGAASASGGNYVKDSILFGVRNDIVEADTGSMGAALSEGLFGPWEAVNLGAGAELLRLGWLMPDADEDARRESLAKRTAAFNVAVKEYRENGFEVSQSLVDELAKQHGVIAPQLAATATTGFVLAPTDLARAITVNEARASVGLAALPDGDVSLASYGQPVPAAPVPAAA